MVETLKEIIGLSVNDYDYIIIIISGLLILLAFRYSLDLFAYLFKFIGGK